MTPHRGPGVGVVDLGLPVLVERRPPLVEQGAELALHGLGIGLARDERGVGQFGEGLLGAPGQGDTGLGRRRIDGCSTGRRCERSARSREGLHARLGGGDDALHVGVGAGLDPLDLDVVDRLAHDDRALCVEELLRQPVLQRGDERHSARFGAQDLVRLRHRVQVAELFGPQDVEERLGRLTHFLSGWHGHVTSP